LAQGFARSQDRECGAPRLHDVVQASNQTWDDVTRLEVVIIVGAENVAGDHRREETAVLLMVRLVHHVDHAFGVAVAEIRRVRGPVMDLQVELDKIPD
jgi:hypothetical protein